MTLIFEKSEHTARAADRLREAAVYALAFAVPVGVLLAICMSMGMAPWGQRTILISDMADQYVEFFCALKQGDLFFSWSKILGTGYIGVFSYYVSSPLSLLTLPVPNEYMPEALMFLAILKMGLAGAAFTLFARKRFPCHDWAALICGVCYALMSYNIVYSICIMWLDGVFWLPLILLALERILAGRGALPYTAALTVCFISTWYISYMVGAFCALYLCARLVSIRPQGKTLGVILLRFFGGAACALGLTAWLWLPTFLAMFNGKFIGDLLDYEGLLSCTPLGLLSQFRSGAYGSILPKARPYVFCGTAVQVLALAYFFLRKIPLRERLANGALLALLAASFLLSPLDKAWHLFRRPTWFPFRYAFLCSFLLLYLAVQALGPLLERLGKGRPRLERGAALVLAVFTVWELGGNAEVHLTGLENQFSSTPTREYRDYYTANARLAAAAKQDAGSRFYRMGATEDLGHNSPLSFGYPGVTHYSSLYNNHVNSLLKDLGFAQASIWCAYYGSSPATDALLDVEYIVAREEIPGCLPLDQTGDLTLWKNPDVLPLAFLPPGGGPFLMLGDTVFERQNSLFSNLLGEEAALFAPLSVETTVQEGETRLSFTGTGHPVYADLSAKGLTEVLVNGKRMLELGSSEAASVHCLGTPERGAPCTVAVRSRGGWTGGLWELDREALHAAVISLDSAESLSAAKNGQVRLRIRTETARPLLTTIPAEEGWTAWVDGKRTETGVWLDTFLMLDLPAGTHSVELRYTPPGLWAGLTLGLLSAAGLALILWTEWAKRGRKRLFPLLPSGGPK